MRLTREAVLALPVGEASLEGKILQADLRDPWKVVVASVLLCRARRMQAKPVLATLLARWPDAGSLARSNVAELEAVLQPCGLHATRARQLQRLSGLWHTKSWDALTDLPRRWYLR